MYKAVYAMNTLGWFDTLPEAFKVIYDAIKKEENISWQVLDTATWIKNDVSLIPLTFYEARDIMCEQGYLVDGHWVDNR